MTTQQPNIDGPVVDVSIFSCTAYTLAYRYTQDMDVYSWAPEWDTIADNLKRTDEDMIKSLTSDLGNLLVFVSIVVPLR